MCLQKYQEFNKELRKKEWTEEEDHMLTELVQKMRVGNFIPYTKIAYFMEGRNSSQLLYRWSKSLDPSVKKGPWTRTEDELLLKAVAKYGTREWFKIQEEVPGRDVDIADCARTYCSSLVALEQLVVTYRLESLQSISCRYAAMSLGGNSRILIHSVTEWYASKSG
eukprot:g36000.t1